MHLDLLQIASIFIVLFAIIDVTGSIPLIINLRKKGETIYPIKTTIIAYLILLAFLFGGELILRLFNVDVHSFAIAGAFVLFIMAMEMVLDVEIFKNKGPEGSSSIVPLAFPLVAGPGTFTLLISLRAQYALINIIIALTLNMVYVFFVLKATDKIQKLLGEGGVYIMRKFFGIILLAVSIKLFMENISFLFAK